MPLNSISAKTLIKGISISLLSCAKPSSLSRSSKGLCKSAIDAASMAICCIFESPCASRSSCPSGIPGPLWTDNFAYSCKRSLSKYEFREGLRRYAAISVSIMIFGVGKSNSSRERINFFSPWPIIPASRRRNCLNSSEIPSSSR